MDAFRNYLMDQKEQENYLKALGKTPQKPPTISPALGVGEDQETNVSKKKKNKKDDPSLTPALGKSKGSGKGGEKKKGLCLDFQTRFKQGGCKKGDKCKYAHEHCKSQQEFDDLLVKVMAGAGSSGEERGRGKATKVASKPELKKFRQEFCYFGATCRGIKDGTCKLDHKKYPDREAWKAAAKKVGYVPKGSDRESSSSSSSE